MPSSRDLAIVLNPEAGEQRTGDRRLRALRALAGSRAVIFATEEPGLVQAVAEGVRERGVDTVAVIGGDGTISFVLSALARAFRGARLPKIALLRGGTMNTTANALGIPRRKPEELLRRLLASRPTASVRQPTISIGGRLGFLWSTGAMVGFLDVLYETRAQKQGSLRALSLLARGSWEALTGGKLIERIEKPVRACIRVDGQQHPLRNYTLLAAGTFERIGLGFRPFPRTAAAEGQFQVFAFHAPLQALARQLPRIRRGLPILEELGFDPLGRRLEIRTGGERLRYALDGDLYQSDNGCLLVEAGPSVEIRVS